MSEIVAESTEHIFGDDFFARLNGVCNALDNVEARKKLGEGGGQTQIGTFAHFARPLR